MSIEVAAPSSPLQRPRTTDPTVIDVDELDDEVQFMGYNRRPEPRHRRHDLELIEVDRFFAPIPRTSSTDAQPGSPSHSRPPSSRRRIFSPPPPPLQPRVIPPVPRLPPHLAAFAAHPRDLPPGFHAHMRARNHQAAIPANEPAPAPLFGYGADALRRLFEPGRAFFAELFGLGRGEDGTGAPIHPADADAAAQAALAELYGAEGDPDAAAAFLPWPDRVRYARRRGAERERTPDFKPTHTHPPRPEPGFAHDFAPEPPVQGECASDPMVIDDDDMAPQPVQAEPQVMTVVCAHCVRPLECGGTGTAEEEECRKRRVWALRCGHVIDGQCLAQLMKPAEPPREPTPPFVEMKGKEKAKDEPMDECIVPKAESRKPGRRNKRKADAEEQEQDVSELPVSKRPRRHEELGPILPDDAVAAGPSDIRSRLRPRPNNPASSSRPVPGPARGRAPRRSAVTETPPPSTAQPAEQRPKAGRGRRSKKPFIEAEHKWACPVPGCAHAHVTQKIEGVWVHKPEHGAIAMYV